MKTITYTSKQLRLKVAGKKWIMSYNRLFAVVDNHNSKVMYIEDYGPKNGFFIEGWRALHFPLTSSLVEKSYREGGITIYIINQGKTKLSLVPSFSPIGIQQCVVRKNSQVLITFAGFGGGGVSASFSRGMAEGVEKVEVIQSGGGAKLGIARVTLPVKRFLLVGVDDTDNELEGATYSLVHNISLQISKELNVFYATHNNVQLFPYNPHKTKNCMSTVIGFIYDHPSQKKKITDSFIRLLKKYSVSKETAIAVYDGFSLPDKLINFSVSLKFHFLDDMDYLKKICKETGVELIPVTGERGLIGAVAALGLYDKPEFAAKLPDQCC